MMKKTLIGIGVLVFVLTGCSDKFSPERKSVVSMMQSNEGTTKIVGWENYKDDSDRDGVPDYKDKCPNTPLGVAVNHQGCPILAQFRFNFKFNSWKIDKKYYPQIQKLAKLLKKNKGIKKIEIQGYTDNIGSYLYNKTLSIKRANALRAILINKYGIKPSRIDIVGFGSDYPVANNNRPEGRAMNRRVTVIDSTCFTNKCK